MVLPNPRFPTQQRHSGPPPLEAYSAQLWVFTSKPEWNFFVHYENMSVNKNLIKLFKVQEALTLTFFVARANLISETNRRLFSSCLS